MSTAKIGARETARLMLREMDELGICYAALYALEVRAERFQELVTVSTIARAVESALSSGIMTLPSYLMKLIENPGAAIREHVEMLRMVNTPSEHVVEVARESGGRIVAVASPDPSQPPDALAERVERLLDMGAAAVKVLPTVQMVDSRLMDRLELIAEILQERGRPLIIHTGCDPGVWELPYFCEAGRPSRFEKLARRFRDLSIVLAHMGAYSALKPGIYMHEAIDMMRRMGNVYGDTAAVEPELIEYAARKVGPEKIVFGTDYPVVAGASWSSLIAVLDELRLPSTWIERIAWMNAAQLLGLKH
jgi:predicted TIM-barrel fold metal-dependent hydrolase